MDGPSLPRYVQIAEMLIRDIAAGRLADGTRLPPEREYAAELGVSVGTLRKALDRLAEAGLLRRIQGSGNYIRAQDAPASVYGFFRLERPGGGGLPTAAVLDVTRLAKPSDLPEFGEGPEAHRIRRLRSLDGTPVALEEIWLCASRAPRLEAGDLSESLYLHYRRALGITITAVADEVGLAPAPDWAPERSGLRPGETCGYVERLSRAQDGARVEASRTWYDAARCRYVSRMGKA
ncbi:GntR family transcriptional regulator [Histidinibacterium aquaticum]|uniref:GntR family transcriptional regulator n=1 Tax=Histidinibacterium aquaticum TaxID=2613962 RepID=A0A5J5GMD4_9RHOB|nr:GntR family transcriptional regulator [Histidinibacterium aquaticum]KAA9009355.1 GntR family transcriptional regulator [Histidinibacterium aquaticum]